MGVYSLKVDLLKKAPSSTSLRFLLFQMKLGCGKIHQNIENLTEALGDGLLFKLINQWQSGTRKQENGIHILKTNLALTCFPRRTSLSLVICWWENMKSDTWVLCFLDLWMQHKKYRISSERFTEGEFEWNIYFFLLAQMNLSSLHLQTFKSSTLVSSFIFSHVPSNMRSVLAYKDAMQKQLRQRIHYVK